MTINGKLVRRPRARRMSVKDAYGKVIYALHKSGFSRDDTLNILGSLYPGAGRMVKVLTDHIFRVYEHKPKEEGV